MSISVFGDGSDGDLIISSPLTLTSDKQYNNLTVNAQLNCAGYRIRVKGTLINNDIIIDNRYSGTSGGATVAPTTSTGANSNSSTAGTNGAGSGGYSGASGGTNYAYGSGGMGWGYAYGGTGGAGGNGGKAGGQIFIYANILNNVGTIDASGGNGSNGTSGGAGQGRDLGDGKAAFGGGGGGGQGGTGGNGGIVEIVYNTLTSLGTITVSGGSKGIGGAGGTTGSVDATWVYSNYGYAGGIGTFGGSGGKATDGLTQTQSNPGDAGVDGRDGKDGIIYLSQLYSSNWIENVTGDNFVNIYSKLFSKFDKRSIELSYLGNGTCSVSQLIDFGVSIEEVYLKIGASVKIASLAGTGAASLTYQFLQSDNTVISTDTIQDFSTVQKYTTYEKLVKAPALAQKIKLSFTCTGNDIVLAYLDNAFVIKESESGIRLTSSIGKQCKLSSSLGKILSAGTITLSNSLNGDNTYGTDIDLNVTTPIAKENIQVFVQARKINFSGKIYDWDWTGYGGNRIFNWFADSAATYYTRDDATGVMTTWVAGNLTSGNQNTWDGLASAYPLRGWHQGIATHFTSIRLWAAMCYIVYDTSATQFLPIYTIGDTGVAEISYVIVVKNV